MDRIVAYDHTAIRDRPKLLWSFGDIPLRGLSLPGLAAGGAVLLGGFAVSGIASMVSSAAGYLVVLLSVAGAIAAYAAWGRKLPEGMKLSEYVAVWLDYRRQPKHLHGLSAADEPTQVRWQIILWAPTDPQWVPLYPQFQPQPDPQN